MGHDLKSFNIKHFVFEPKHSLKKTKTLVAPYFEDDNQYRKILEELTERTADRQDLLFAERKNGVVALLQGMDTAGKDGAIKAIFGGLNPLGVEASAFGAPSADERRRDFLWRTHSKVPPRGKIGVFNRSYYEEVLAVRVHEDLLKGQELPDDVTRKGFWKNRFEDIRNFEKYLVNQGYLVLKFFLHISEEEQKKRLLARIDDHRKNWKFDPGDLDDRARWKEFMHAYDDCFKETSTKASPWYIVPADDKQNARLIVAAILNHQMEALPLHDPKISDAQKKILKNLRKLI